MIVRLGERLPEFLCIALVILGILADLPLIGLSALAGLVFVMIWRQRHARLSTVVATEPSRSGSLVEARAVLDAITLPLIIVEARGLVTYGNAAARQAFPACRPGIPLSSVLRAPDVLAALEQVLEQRVASSVDWHERVPVERSYAIAITPLREAGSPGDERAVLQIFDMTEQRRTEAMRVDFIANASHELRTPLASLLGFVETLQGPARDDAAARIRFLDIMRQQAERMRRLIDDLLSLSRIEMRAHIPPTDAVDIASILPQVRDGLSGIARERNVEIRIEGSGQPAIVSGDRDELLRLFENLIENGIKYGASGKRVEVGYAYTPDERGIRVSVRDFGPGIPSHHLPRLTERFYRADVRESREHGGTGLGLALVKHIVARHRGRLQIESTEGAGAAFHVSLPRFMDVEKQQE